MIHLTNNDLLQVITPRALDELTDTAYENDQDEDIDSLLDAAELTALGEITGYLDVRFDSAKCFDTALLIPDPETNAIYPGVATCRQKLADVMVYHLHARIVPDNVPKARENRYNNAINWLEKVAEGFINPQLPVKEVEEESTPLRYGNSSAPQKPNY